MTHPHAPINNSWKPYTKSTRSSERESKKCAKNLKKKTQSEDEDLPSESVLQLVSKFNYMNNFFENEVFIIILWRNDL